MALLSLESFSHHSQQFWVAVSTACAIIVPLFPNKEHGVNVSRLAERYKMDIRDEKSPKSYGVAVILCGIFGTMGIHHFYLGNIVHGLFDLGLFILFCVLFFGNAPLLGILVLLLDAAHTIYVFSMLIVEKWHDGEGRRVTL